MTAVRESRRVRQLCEEVAEFGGTVLSGRKGVFQYDPWQIWIGMNVSPKPRVLLRGDCNFSLEMAQHLRRHLLGITADKLTLSYSARHQTEPCARILSTRSCQALSSVAAS